MATGKQEMKVVKTIAFNSDKPEDSDLISKANTYASFYPGINPHACVRNLLLRKLDEEIGRLQQEKQLAIRS